MSTPLTPSHNRVKGIETDSDRAINEFVCRLNEHFKLGIPTRDGSYSPKSTPNSVEERCYSRIKEAFWTCRKNGQKPFDLIFASLEELCKVNESTETKRQGLMLVLSRLIEQSKKGNLPHGTLSKRLLADSQQQTPQSAVQGQVTRKYCCLSFFTSIPPKANSHKIS